jgi:hypothetical protein
MDELERAVDDVTDESVRRGLFQLLARLDDTRDDLAGELARAVTYDLFDPLRIVMADIRLEG